MRLSTEGICIIENCKSRIYAKRLCSIHYGRLLHNKRLGKLDFNKRELRQCFAFDCKNYEEIGCYCSEHHELFKKYGSPYRPRIIEYCSIKKCNKLHFKKGLCEKHYEILKDTTRGIYL